ncbi:Hint domain-containing protein [Chachezhania sediminis]|uniref:Hint domain-containing protein n=1 Tax=Chachezhania sediminis TaxID=2599291 RepID=UPI00131A968F|nr:Hint domain-containing protein [Chachezhania sediminis]
MANGTIVLYGIDFVDGASVGTNSSAGTNGAGTATISGGNQVFESDDIVVIDVKKVNQQGEVTGQSGITGITVYNSMDDYRNGIAKYTYTPMNPGQTASIQSDVSGEGDGYLRFNSNVLVPRDGGPYLNNSIIAPGTDLGVASKQPGGLTMNRYQDFDFNQDGVIDPNPIEQGDTLFYAGDYTPYSAPICFARSTRIRTPRGERRIEDLRPGDLVSTLDNGDQPVRWIGRCTTAARGDVAPICFAPGAIGNTRELRLSPNHRLLVRGSAVEFLFAEPEMLVPAKFLVNGTDIVQRQGGIVTYLHLMFDRHEILWAEGVLSESLFSEASAEDANAVATLDENRALQPGFEAAAERIQTARPCLRRHEALVLCNAGRWQAT